MALIVVAYDGMTLTTFVPTTVSVLPTLSATTYWYW